MRRPALLLAALAAALASCASPFEPTVDDGRAFALFGTLDGRRPVQALRVQDLSIAVGRTPAVLPATVTSTELTSGVTTTWRDSLVTLTDGTTDHLFVADLTVSAGEVHRVEAVRDADGATSSVTLALPDPMARAGDRAESDSTAIRIHLDGLPGPVSSGAAIVYRIRRPDGTGERDLAVPVTLAQTPPTATFLALVGTAITQARVILGVQDVVLLGVRLEALVQSASPVPVEAGVGAVGFVVPVSVEVPLPPEVLGMAGFVDARGG